jgi:Asp-tRNA(Asn)/Glu-tRNA(Gln) amidotransferase A subunit family amidase
VANDLLFRPADELATLVHTGQVTSTELVTAALERIEELEPTLNAFVHVDADGALATAAAIERDDARPFAGVPIAIKDTTSVAGMIPCCNGYST